MDCCDRFALWLAELTLDRVRALAETPGCECVTVGASCDRRRFRVTIRQAGEGQAEFRWDVRESYSSALGGDVNGTLELSSGERGYGDPEEAYWAAWGEIEREVRAAA